MQAAVVQAACRSVRGIAKSIGITLKQVNVVYSSS